MSRFAIVAAALVAVPLVACNKPAPTATPIRPVRAITVERSATGETISLTGQVRAKDEESLAFRIGGRLLERPVHVGDLLKAGQLVGRLDPRDEQNAVRMAEAKLAGDNARLLEAGKTYWRQQELLKNGWTPQARFDQAEQALRSAQAMVDSDRAALRVAQDLLGYTVLFADAPGAVAATGGEPGEVVTAGQMIAKVARQGGRDAVFDVPEQLILTGPRDPVVQVALTNDSGVTATGRVREVAPQADSATRTFEVKVGLIDPPGAMRLGSTVTGRINLAPPPGVEIPATALTESNGRPAVWIVDPRIHTVSLRTVDVLRYDATSVVIGQGLKKGDVVVTAGVQVLRPGQQVRLLGAA